ncbi:pilus assembly FimT family protein [Granulosicoccus sp. 3-233]|uniref:pilus assembly FimT family protein n=1 Tax=Granulosicoccus sp. 3-233 TaxID=3417969 RepID=UPI003D330C2E
MAGTSWSRPAASRARGFTLIELLVTVTIISILVGAVVINIDFRNVGKSVRATAQRTGLLMDLAADQAVYARQQFGIRFHPESYEFYILNEDEEGDSTWEIFEDGQLRFRPEDVPVEFQVDISGLPIVLEDLVTELAEATEEDPLKPHVIFLSNGEIIPDFRILISDLEGEFRYEVATGEVLPVVVEQLEGS